MTYICNSLYNKIYCILKNIGIKEINKIHILNCKNIEFGHYQINGIYFFIKKYSINEKLLINKIYIEIKKLNFVEKIEKNYNFINIFLKKEWIENKLNKMILSNKFNFTYSISNKNIVIDYSSPNLTKEMHVGHLRSTIIGDSISRILEFLENNIIRINHVGDWGINFGMLIAKIIKLTINKNFNYEKISIKEIEKLYKESKKEYNNTINFSKESQKCLYELQNNNYLYKKIWNKIIEVVINNNQKLYNTLNIKLKINNIIGESFYIKIIPDIIKDLLNKKIAINKYELILIPLKEIKNRNGKNMSVIIQKKDKTYLYSTIEIASIKYRCSILKANRIIYYTDSRQSSHLNQSFIIAKKAGYILNSTLFEHHSFGMILNKFNKPFKTREGNVFKLIDLINKSIKKTKEFILSKNKKFNINKINKLSKIIGIGSLKYFDLSKNRKNNYIFNLNEILSLKNNTAIYIYYSYVRILSILRKYGIKNLSNLKYLENGFLLINSKEEMNLSLSLIKFENIIYNTSKLGMPNILCSYLYEISTKFSKIYTKKNILDLKNKKLKISKLNLCILTAKIIKKSLNLLGIKTTEEM